MFWYQFQLFLILKNWFNFSFFSFLSLGTAAQKVGRKREKKYPSWSQHIKNRTLSRSSRSKKTMYREGGSE